MNCSSCGNNLAQNAKFCENCGSPVNKTNYGAPSSKAMPHSNHPNNPNNLVGQKKLYRSRKNRVLAGVCGGIGEYYNTDPTLVRLLLVIITLIYGFGLLAYLIAILVIPESPYDPWKEPNYQ